MRHGFITPALLALAFGAAANRPLCAQCDGDVGWSLDLPDVVGLGENVVATLDGPANEMGLLMVSLGQGPIKSSYGTVCLDFPLVAAIPFAFDATGHLVISGDIPCDPALIDLTLYMQFITCKPMKGISNQESMLIEDALHAGDLCTYTQGGWGADCSGNNPGCLLQNSFDGVFPTGLLIGDDAIADGDQIWAACWGSAAALNVFLPIGGNPGVLTQDDVDPTVVPACVFAGQLVSAKLNVGFDDAGQFDAGKCRDDLKLGDMIFVSGVDADLIGWSVRELIILCDVVVSGELGAGPYDINGDAVNDVTIKDLNNALDALNRNFDNCTTNLGYLDVP